MNADRARFLSVSVCLTTRLFVPVLAIQAQDLRTVTEPVIPPVCTTLTAARVQIDEAELDTSRIQQALDSCPAGHAVELTHDSARATFLSGPLELRRGVTLLVDRGVRCSPRAILDVTMSGRAVVESWIRAAADVSR